MARDTFYTAIDLGTTKICTMIARIGPDGELKVLGTGIVPSQGVLKGRVENTAEAQAAVKASLEEAQRYLGKGVSWTYLGVTGNHISCLNTTSTLNGSSRDGAISTQDIRQLMQDSYPDVAEGKEVLHVIPISYAVDGMMGVRNPIGLHADMLEVESHVVMGDAPILKNLVRTVEACKISVRSMVLQPLAAAEAILTEDEREMGAVLVDMGGGTTDVVVVRDREPLVYRRHTHRGQSGHPRSLRRPGSALLRGGGAQGQAWPCHARRSPDRRGGPAPGIQGPVHQDGPEAGDVPAHPGPANGDLEAGAYEAAPGGIEAAATRRP